MLFNWKQNSFVARKKKSSLCLSINIYFTSLFVHTVYTGSRLQWVRLISPPTYNEQFSFASFARYKRGPSVLVDCYITPLHTVFCMQTYVLLCIVVAWLVLSELFPSHVRGRAISVSTVFNWGTNLVVALTFLNLMSKFSMSLHDEALCTVKLSIDLVGKFLQNDSAFFGE